MSTAECWFQLRTIGRRSLSTGETWPLLSSENGWPWLYLRLTRLISPTNQSRLWRYLLSIISCSFLSVPEKKVGNVVKILFVRGVKHVKSYFGTVYQYGCWRTIDLQGKFVAFEKVFNVTRLSFWYLLLIFFRNNFSIRFYPSYASLSDCGSKKKIPEEE